MPECAGVSLDQLPRAARTLDRERETSSDVSRQGGREPIEDLFTDDCSIRPIQAVGAPQGLRKRFGGNAPAAPRPTRMRVKRRDSTEKLMGDASLLDFE